MRWRRCRRYIVDLITLAYYSTVRIDRVDQSSQMCWRFFQLAMIYFHGVHKRERANKWYRLYFVTPVLLYTVLHYIVSTTWSTRYLQHIRQQKKPLLIWSNFTPYSLAVYGTINLRLTYYILRTPYVLPTAYHVFTSPISDPKILNQ